MEELCEAIGERALRVRPAVPVPNTAHGAFAICRIHRRAWPNTQINSACVTTTQVIFLAEDGVPRAGRCRRVIVVTADDVSSR